MLTELEAVLSWFWIRLLALQVYSAASDFCMAENVKVSPDTEERKEINRPLFGSPAHVTL